MARALDLKSVDPEFKSTGFVAAVFSGKNEKEGTPHPSLTGCPSSY